MDKATNLLTAEDISYSILELAGLGSKAALGRLFFSDGA
jgi:hypothetical protein